MRVIILAVLLAISSGAFAASGDGVLSIADGDQLERAATGASVVGLNDDVLEKIITLPELAGFRGVLRMVCRKFRDVLPLGESGTARTNPLLLSRYLSSIKWGYAPINPRTAWAAIGYGNIPGLEWLHTQHNIKLDAALMTAAMAAGYGNVEVLKWFHTEHNIELDAALMAAAVAAGHPEIVEFLIESNCSISKEVWEKAISNRDRIDVLELLLDTHDPSDKTVGNMAAAACNLDALKLIHSKGHAVDLDAVDLAARTTGRLYMFNWAMGKRRCSLR